MAFRTLADRSKGCEWPITWYTWHVRQIFLREWDSWILWVNNDAVQTTEHKSAVLLISFCKTSIFFSFLEGKDWWRRSHGRLTYYSFYVDSVYIFNYKCIWFLFFLSISYLLYKWNAIKKRFMGGNSFNHKHWRVNTRLQTHLSKEFRRQYSFLNISY